MKLRGRWTLARMGGRRAEGVAPAKDWLLLKAPDAYADSEEPVERAPESVFSGLTVEEIGGRVREARRARYRPRVARGAGRRGRRPAGSRSCLRRSRERTPAGPGWLFEIKYDGVRVLAERDGDTVALYGRKGDAVTARYPEVVRALRALPVSRFVIDGEIVALGEDGRPSFQRLQARMHLTRADDIDAARAAVPATRDLLRLPRPRRSRSAPPAAPRAQGCLELLVPARGVVRYCEHVVGGAGPRSSRRWASSVSRASSPSGRRARYAGGRSRDWLKVKCQHRQEFVIGGYTAPQGSRGYFGALHLGLYEDDRLVYVSKVGTGFDERALAAIARAPRPARPRHLTVRGGLADRPRAPLGGAAARLRGTLHRLDGGRAASAIPPSSGSGDDRRPEECRRERPIRASGRAPTRRRRPPGKAKRPARRAAGGTPGGERSPTPRRCSGRRKAIPRPISSRTTRRWRRSSCPTFATARWCSRAIPTGSRASLSSRRTPPTSRPRGSAPSASTRTTRSGTSTTSSWTTWSRSATWRTSARSRCTSGARESRTWTGRTGSSSTSTRRARRSPTWWQVARALRRILERLELPSHVKTSGATGLHILLPLGARYTHEETRTFARLLATLGVEAAGASRPSPVPSAPAAARSTSTSARTATAAPSWRRTPCARCRGRRCRVRFAGTR